jgi:hypothetical protein
MTLIPADWAAEAGRVLREQAGIDLVALTPTSRGESGAAFWITDRAGTVMLLKIVHGPAREAMRNLSGLEAMTGLLRERGYPAVLRQVDWTVRHHPGSAAAARHLRLARLVMADITSDPPS